MGYAKVCDVKDQIVSLYQQGKQKKDISKILNVSEYSITKFFKDNCVYRFNENCFETIDSEEKAYWLGFLWADGNISEYAIFLELQDSDKNHLEKFRKFLKNEYQNFDITKGNCIRLRANSKKIVEDLKSLGFGLKDNRVDIPNISPDLIRHFIRGYFDGDGHIRIKNNLFEGVDISGRSKFIENLNDLLKFSRSEEHSTDSKRIYANKEHGLKFLNFVYNDATVYLERKYSCALLYRNI